LTQAEIADVFDVSLSVISERFRTEITRARAHWKLSLRRAQWKRAKAGSDAMLIHLGKSELGQTYKLDVANTGKPTVVYVAHADNPRDDSAAQRARALTKRSRAAGTVLQVEDNGFGKGGGDPCNGMKQLGRIDGGRAQVSLKSTHLHGVGYQQNGGMTAHSN
jgi:hypothetical protein